MKTFIALLLSCSLCAADEPAKAVITDVFGNPPPTEYRPAATLFFSAAGSVHGDDVDSVVWTVIPPLKIVSLWDRVRAPMVAVETGKEPPGSIVVVLSVAKADGCAAVALPLFLDGQFPRPGPDPKPDPRPDPKPDPKPPDIKLSLAFIEDVRARTAETAQILNNQKYWDALKNRGHAWRVYHRESPETLPDGVVVKDTVVPLPTLLIFAPGGKRVGTLFSPKSTAQIDREIAKFTTR